ncbi:MAG: acyl-ACP--UDP-N-acetylglucosamine O-acyltransferase, partial [Acidobacteria bacterium]|nr:acyl-ACP--UDP-N-acetylglucosamine O-acyltransferase [Acidobacteriota bacterium]
GVLMIESLTQAATLLLLHDGEQVRNARTVLRRVSETKFRRQVTPGDQVMLDVEIQRRRGPVARLLAVATVAGQVVTEARLHMAVLDGAVMIHPSASVHPGAVIGPGSVVGPHVSIGPDVRIGRNNRIGASCVIDGRTEFGDDNTLYPFGSFGQAPQDLKYKGEPTRLVIGHDNVFREFVTIHRGTVTGRSVTTIGHRNYLMAYSHVAHDCLVGNDTILSHGTTLGGHVDVDDFATLGGYAGIHQFCRVGKYAFIGGFSACTKDVLPFSKTVGNRAMIYGVNSIGLVRRGFTTDTVRKLKSAYRYLLVSKLNTTQALERIDQDVSIDCPEVRYLVAFIRSAKRGVILKRATRRTGESTSDE